MSHSGLNRRDFLAAVIASGLAARSAAAQSRAPRILLRSSWQVVNIGDIAHTPGVLALLERYLPDAEVRLWASGDLSAEVAEMEHRRFPKLEIVKGSLRPDGRASQPDLEETVQWADFLLHGSGPSLVAEKDVAIFASTTGKPYGVYGITYGGGSPQSRETLSGARFVYFRDSVSLAKAQSDGVSCPVMEFGPDGAFACDLRNDAAATEFLKVHQLQAGKFLCCIPRLRYTPYWLIKKGRAFDAARDRRNQERAELDHAPLREAITRVVRETDHKVLICPEDMTQMQVGQEHLVDKLPADVRDGVVWREKFWLTDEALSTYRQSSGLFGLEMHSPIMAVGNGIPAIVGRFAEQTSKGFMWRDIGLNDWLFDMDQPDQTARYAQTVVELVTQPDEARKKVLAAQKIVRERQVATMRFLKSQLP